MRLLDKIKIYLEQQSRLLRPPVNIRLYAETPRPGHQLRLLFTKEVGLQKIYQRH